MDKPTIFVKYTVQIGRDVFGWCDEKSFNDEGEAQFLAMYLRAVKGKKTRVMKTTLREEESK